jgi:acylphosphatase
MKNEVRAHIVVGGRVQGVLYRRGAQKKAGELGVTGLVHNTLDGKVELIAEGDKQAVQRFIVWCKQGTSLANVETCDVTFEPYKNEFPEGFTIREFGF